MKTGTCCPRQFGDHAPLISGAECMGLGVRAISKEKLLLWTSPHFAGCPRYGSSSPQWACTESSKAQGAWLPHLDFKGWSSLEPARVDAAGRAAAWYAPQAEGCCRRTATAESLHRGHAQQGHGGRANPRPACRGRGMRF